MTTDQARYISTWVYAEPYSLYSMDGSEELIKELMDGSYFAVMNDEKEVVGYFCYGGSAQVPGLRKYGVYEEEYIDIGLGMKPDLTGKKLSFDFLLTGMKFGSLKFQNEKFRLTVATCNERAIKAYEKVGFKRGQAYVNKTPNGEREFVIMKRER